ASRYRTASGVRKGRGAGRRGRPRKGRESGRGACPMQKHRAVGTEASSGVTVFGDRSRMLRCLVAQACTKAPEILQYERQTIKRAYLSNVCELVLSPTRRSTGMTRGCCDLRAALARREHGRG